MAENDGTGLSTSRPAGAVLPTIIAAFNTYQADFMAITRRGKARFERCDWRGALADAAERLDLCGHVIDDLEREVHSALGARVSDRHVWAAMKTAYSGLIRGRADGELAETFFNSITRRIVVTVGVDPNIEFAEADVRPAGSVRELPLRTYQRMANLADLVATILHDCGFDCEFEDLRRDAGLVADRLAERLTSAAGSDRDRRPVHQGSRARQTQPRERRP